MNFENIEDDMKLLHRGKQIKRIYHKYHSSNKGFDVIREE
jgi:hypothetical protein